MPEMRKQKRFNKVTLSPLLHVVISGDSARAMSIFQDFTHVPYKARLAVTVNDLHEQICRHLTDLSL